MARRPGMSLGLVRLRAGALGRVRVQGALSLKRTPVRLADVLRHATLAWSGFWIQWEKNEK